MFSFTGKQWKIINESKNFDSFLDFLSSKIDKKKVNWKEDLINLEPATELILDTIKKKEKIVIVGDYDADGILGTSLMKIILTRLEADFVCYIPDRFTEGYGLTSNIIKKFKDFNLVITIDNGTTSHEALEEANKINIKTLFIDHHMIGKEIYPTVFVNPYLNNKLTYLCGTGLTFFIVLNLIEKTKINLKSYDIIDIVAVATVCDIMPMIGLNRIIVEHGIKKLKTNPHPCFKIILDKETDIDSDSIGFLIGPFLNSAGRFGQPQVVIEMISNENLIDNYHKLIGFMTARKNIESEIIKNISDFSYKNKDYIVCHREDWHEGVIGIIASKVKDKFNATGIIISWKDHIGSGSIRSKENFDTGTFIKKAIAENILICGGGHKAAGGFKIEKKNFNRLIDFLDNFPLEIIDDSLEVHLVSFWSLNEILAEKIKKLTPFGNKNPEPLLLISGCKINNYRLIKEKHLYIEISDEYNMKKIQGFIFNFTEKLLHDIVNPHLFDIVGYLKKKSDKLQFILVDAKIHKK